MAKALEWSAAADETIIRMRADGQTWQAIASAMGLHRNTVIERGRRLNAKRGRISTPVTNDVKPDWHRGPLPAGDSATWGLISDQEFPEYRG